MPSFSFILTEKCNWECPYCYFTGINQKEPKMEVYKKHLPYIKKIIDKLGDIVVNIDIQGGEIGTIPIELLEYFFQTIKKPIVVSTNGMFLEKKMNLNEKIRPYLSAIMYHVYNFNPYPTIIKNYEDNDIPILRGIVHDDIEKIINFIKKTSFINFDYVEFEYDINEARKIDKEKYKELLYRLEELPNVTDNAKNIIRGRLNENSNHRDNCKKYNHSILIDLVNANICLCQRQLDINIPLTEENLIYRLKTFPKDIFKDDHCESCTRLYYGKFQGNVIERALLTRNKI